MTVEHYIVFIGAGAALATQLFLLEGRIAKSRVIAPAVGKKQVGVTEAAVELASKKLHDQIAGEDSPSRQARLYLWMYEPTNFDNLALVWKVFGHASWVETIPRSYLHKVTARRGRVLRILPWVIWKTGPMKFDRYYTKYPIAPMPNGKRLPLLCRYATSVPKSLKI